jgi:predicted Holliday junction resolvase-like endonuclease
MEILETLSLDNARLIILLVLFIGCAFLFLLAGLKIGFRQGKKSERAEWEGYKIKDIVKKRLKQSRAVLGGLVSEQLAPLLPGFPFDPGDCRFIGKPVDFIVFKGMNEKEITEVIFLEVKSGKDPALSDQERCLRDVIGKGRVRWAEYYAGN